MLAIIFIKIKVLTVILSEIKECHHESTNVLVPTIERIIQNYTVNYTSSSCNEKKIIGILVSKDKNQRVLKVCRSSK